MAITFSDLLAQADNANLNRRVVLARDWFREQAQKSVITPTKLMTEDRADLQPGLNGNSIGRLFLFRYDAKLKKELPYWDQFPVVFPFAFDDTGFLGINLHYLPPKYRAVLMDALYSIVNNQKYDKTTKLNISYRILKTYSKFKYARPCIKKYLWDHVRSQYLHVPAVGWDLALFMPLQRFQKADVSVVWKDSLEIANRERPWGGPSKRNKK
jgi:hypothetical protein